MGDYLSVPDKQKHSEVGSDDRVIIRFCELFQLAYCATGMQGWRKSMEDSHIANLNIGDGCSLFGVFDGHGGKF